MNAPVKASAPAPEAPLPKAVVDALPNPLIVLDADERICLANVAAEDYFQASSNVLLRHRLGDLVPFSSPVFVTVRYPKPALFSVTSGLPTRLIVRPSSCFRRSGRSRATISTSCTATSVSSGCSISSKAFHAKTRHGIQRPLVPTQFFKPVTGPSKWVQMGLRICNATIHVELLQPTTAGRVLPAQRKQSN